MTAPIAVESVVTASRRTFHGVLAAVVLGASTAALTYSAARGGPAGAFTLPVLVHALVMLSGFVVSSAFVGHLRLDGLTLFLAWEVLRGSVAPVIIQWVGSGDNFLWRPGTYEDATTALWIGVLFATALVAARAVIGVLERGRGPVGPVPVGLRDGASTNGPVPASVFLALGLVGLLLRFPTIGSVTDFLSGSIEGLQHNDVVPKGPLVFLGQVCRPLLVVGLVMVTRDRRRSGRSWWWLVPPIIVAFVFGLGSFGLNRAAIAFAALALAVMTLERMPRPVRLVPTVVAVGLLGSFFFFVGVLRSTLWLSRTGLEDPDVGVVPALQSVLVYAASPMQLAGAMPWAASNRAFGARTFALSLVGPIPGIPDHWRSESGVALYNHAVYHSFVGRDQLVPSWFEAYLSFGVIGTVALGVVVALLIAGVERLRRRVRSPASEFGTALLLLWVTQPSAVGTYSIVQNVLYFALPPLLIVAIAGCLRPTTAQGHLPSTTSKGSTDESPHALRDLRADSRVPRHAHGRDTRQPARGRARTSRRRHRHGGTTLPR